MGMTYLERLSGEAVSTDYECVNNEGRRYTVKHINPTIFEDIGDMLFHFGNSPSNGELERGEGLALSINHPNLIKTHALILYNDPTEDFRLATELSSEKEESRIEWVLGTVTEIMPDAEELSGSARAGARISAPASPHPEGQSADEPLSGGPSAGGVLRAVARPARGTARSSGRRCQPVAAARRHGRRHLVHR